MTANPLHTKIDALIAELDARGWFVAVYLADQLRQEVSARLVEECHIVDAAEGEAPLASREQRGPE